MTLGIQGVVPLGGTLAIVRFLSCASGPGGANVILVDARRLGVDWRAVRPGPLAHVGEQLARKDEESLLLHEALADPLSILLRQVAVVEVRVSRLPLGAVDMVGEVLRDEPVEQEAEHVGLEVPAVHASAQVVCDLPDRPVERGALGLLAHRAGLVVGKGCGGQCATRLRPPSPGARVRRRRPRQPADG